MAIKMLSPEWEALQKENVKLRDSTRRRFFSELGIIPAKEMSEVDMSSSSRLNNMQNLVRTTLSGKENDVDLQAITQLANTILSELTPGFMSFTGPSLAFDVATMHPHILRGFFWTEGQTTYETARDD
ncbi:hypothetical protein [Pseudovibrio sp. Ad37]|uniref:hypothetical protein n=1 Tax=Pseudovibrio sp. Ad37 TaxID=989422 RepID=UPI0007AECFE6|nr:hypothetical protein [Pseudovibrio sp. Ad37]KZL25134.1 hypothetical protein PsAD37_02308 [Pseudovibrio sp. Ad37]